MTDAPSVSKLAGQLVYIFEDDPALRDAPVTQLRDRLALEDRVARARHQYPNDNDAEIQARLGEFDDRVTTADVGAAVAEARRRLDD
jgi:transposase